MNKKILMTIAATALAITALAGCSATPSASTGASTPTAVANADIKVATSPTFGKIVVDGKGMTAYFFDKDTVGATTSACVATCATLWAPITTTSATPVIDGVSAAFGTIATTMGAMQVTVNGRPIYTYTKDVKAGDTAGQGVGTVWYVLDDKGNEVKVAPTASSGY